MISPVHNELDTFSNRAELPNDKFITDKVIVMGDMKFEMLRINGVVIISIVTNNNSRACNCVLNVTYARDIGIGMNVVGIGT